MDARETLKPPPTQILHNPTPRRPGTFSSLTPPTTSTSIDHSRAHYHSPAPSSPGSSSASHLSGSSVSPPPTPPELSNTAMPRTGSSTQADAPQKSRSILNLTSSTLFGIYSPSSYDGNRDEPYTPSGSGAQTPLRNGSFDVASGRIPAQNVAEQALRKRRLSLAQPNHKRAASTSHRRKSSLTADIFSASWRAVVLFVMGMGYGDFVTHLHDTQEVAPVQVRGIETRSLNYLLFWGTTAVVTGFLLPWIDRSTATYGEAGIDGARSAFADEQELDGEEQSPEKGQVSSGLGADWNPIVRTIGAFVGIAFAIRRLPWQSTLQVSLTLALANPFLWYLIDRSKAGFTLSSIFGFSGAAALLSINPDIIPSPAAPKLTQTLLMAGITTESIGVATWIASVLFCSCVCFGNVGRLLSRNKSHIP